MLDPRVEALIAKEPGGCWLWTGRRNFLDYGRCHLTGRMAHRLTYEDAFGPIPDGLTIDHLCRNRVCVNPAHLEAVTLKENILRGNGTSAINARKTHCKNGHALVSGNLYNSNSGRRTCATCKKAATAMYAARAKAVQS